MTNQTSLVPKQNRQVSFELHASRSNTDLMYNNFDNLSQSVIEAGDFNFQAATAATDDDDEKLSEKNSHLMSNLSLNSVNNSSQVTDNNNEIMNSLLTTASDFQTTFLSNQADHLKPAKLHHLNSFVSRSSRASNESPSSELSSSFYSHLQSSLLNMPKGRGEEGQLHEVGSVGFELNEAGSEEGASRYASARNSPVVGTETKFETANEGSESGEGNGDGKAEDQTGNKTGEHK